MVRTAKVLPKGQITIPREVRDALRAQEGDIVIFEQIGDTWTISRQPARLVDLMREVGREGRPMSDDELEEIDASGRDAEEREERFDAG